MFLNVIFPIIKYQIHASNILRGCIPYQIDQDKIVPLRKTKEKIHIWGNIYVAAAYTCITGINIVFGKANISHKLFGTVFPIGYAVTEACRCADDWISIPNWINAVTSYEKQYIKCKYD